LSPSSSFRFIAKFVILGAHPSQPVGERPDGPSLGMPVIVRNIVSSFRGEAR
jgi:hypothetical protein